MVAPTQPLKIDTSKVKLLPTTAAQSQPPSQPANINKPPDISAADYYQKHYANLYNNLPPELQRNHLSPQKAIERQLGYAPNFAQDPQQIAQAYKIIKSTPKDMSLPTWMQGQEQLIEQAYKWHQFRNKGAPDSDWKWLPGDDPAISWLGSLQGPPEVQDTSVFTGNPYASGIDAVKKGQAAWTDIPIAERQKLLDDPTFDIAQYDVTQRDAILKDPNFHWERVPKWQKLYYTTMSNPAIMASPMAFAGANAGGMFGLPGRAVGAVVGYGLGVIGGQQYDPTAGVFEQPTTVAGMMAVLNKLSEGAEQAQGYIIQEVDAIGGALQGNQRAQQAAINMVIDPATRKAAWEAGRLEYEVGDLFGARNWIPALASLFVDQKISQGETWQQAIDRAGIQFAGKGEDFIIGRADPYQKKNLVNPVTGNVYEQGEGNGVLREIRLTIHDAIVKGEDPRVVVQLMLQTHGQFVGGQIGDFAAQAAIDPLEALPGVTNATSEKLARMLGNETAARAFAETNAPFEAARRYRDLVQTGDVAPGFDYAAMSPMSRWWADINEKGQIKAGALTNEALLDTPTRQANTWSKLKNDWLALTPEARAREGASMFYRNVGVLLSTFDDPHDAVKFLNTISKGDMKVWKEMGGKVANSPEWYTVLPALKDFKTTTLDGLIQAWELPAEKRARLTDIANILGEEPGKLIEDLAKRGTPDEDLARLTQRLQQAGPEGAPLLREIEAGKFTAAHLKDIVDAFTGPGAMHWHPDQWKASVLDALGKHFDEWSVEKLQLGKDTPEAKAFFRTAHLLKSAQSVLLLGGSPGYALQNGLSNMVHRAATGIYGYMTPKQIDTWLDRFGITPARLDEGVGMGGMVEQAGTTSRVHTEAMNKALRGNDGWMGRAQRTVSAIGSAMPFNKLSSAFERIEGKNGLMIAMRDMWSKTWRRGVGFGEMTPELRTHLERAGISANAIYNLIEAGMNQKEIERFIFGRQQGILSRSLINEAAQQVGIPADQAARMLEKVGVLDALDKAMTKASTPDDVRMAFKAAADHASEFRDMQTANDLKAMAENVTNLVSTEGAPAALDVVQRVNSNYYDAWMEHFFRMGEIFDDLDAIPDEALRQAAIEQAYERSNQDFRRINARTAAQYQGILDAWGLSDNTDARTILASIASNDAVMRDAYEFMRQARRDFMDTYRDIPKGSLASQAAWGDMQAQISARFAEAFDTKHANDVRMGDSLAKIYNDLYGPAAGEAARKWWKDVVDFQDDIVKRENKFRASLAKMDKEQRAIAKHQYYGTEKIAQIAELEQINKKGIERLERVIKRSKGGSGTTATGDGGPGGPGPVKPTTPGPAAAPEGVVDNLRTDYSQRIEPARTRVDVRQEIRARLDEQTRISPEEEYNALMAEAERRATQERAENATRSNAVWDQAAEFGLTRDTYHEIALKNAMRKAEYGGIPDLGSLGDPRLTPEKVREVLTKRAEIKANEAGVKQERVITREQIRLKKKPAKDLTVLQAIIKNGGLKADLIPDVAGDRPAGYPGLFRDTGMNLDDMIVRLQEDKFLIDNNAPDDPGGVRQATEMIQRALNGEDVFPMDHDFSKAEEKQIKQAELEHAQRLAAEYADTEGITTFDQERWEIALQNAVDAGDLTRMYDIIGELPTEIGATARADGVTWNDYVSKLADDTVLKAADQYRSQVVADLQERVAVQQADMQNKADAAMSRQLMREKLIQEVGLPEAQADAYMQISDSVAAWYAKATGEDPSAFYSRYYADIRRESVKAMDYLKQDPRQPVWYSKAEQTVTAIRQETMTVEQLRGMLNKGGVKAEELRWLGIEDLLKDRSGSITKQEILDTIAENNIQMTEIVKGKGTGEFGEFNAATAKRVMDQLENDNGWNLYKGELEDAGYTFEVQEEDPRHIAFTDNETGELLDAGEIEDKRIARYARDMADIYTTTWNYHAGENEQMNATRYGGYILPGDYTGYREILFTLPQQKPAQLPQDASIVPIYRRKKVVGYEVQQGNLTIGRGATPMDATTDALTKMPRGVRFQSSHWAEPDVLAHTRLTDRIDADGKRVLFVEEVQSDWHQKGREQGYQENKADRIAQLNEEQTTLRKMLNEEDGMHLPETDAFMQLMDRFEEKYMGKDGYRGGWLYKLDETEMAQYKAAQKAADDARDKGWARLQEIESERIQTEKGVAPAPFAKTWHEMVMKRIMRMAADEGFERVAWTTGEQQAARYDLAKQVDAIEYSKDADGNFQLWYRKGTTVGDLGEGAIPPDRLASHVGKDVAQRIIDDAGTKTKTKGVKRLEAENLTVGGEGMKGFYDKMLPGWVEKYGKKWGITVGETILNTSTRTTSGYHIMVNDDAGNIIPLQNEMGTGPWTFDSRMEAEQIVDTIGEGNIQEVTLKAEDGTETVHSIDVTPDLVRGVMEGQPLFQSAAQGIAPVNRAMNSTELGDYAYLLNRQGADSLRRAVTYEPDPKSRQRLLNEVHKINPVLAETVARQTADILFQDTTKGAVTFDETGIKGTIHAFERADISTVIHENAHIYRRVLLDVATRTQNAHILADLKTIEEWAGVKDGAWTRAAEETFAQGFERYITDGVAPTTKLTSAFAKMRDWMLGIYKVITGTALDVKITPEVRAVFDRMLSDEPGTTPTPQLPSPSMAMVPSPSMAMLQQEGAAPVWYHKSEQIVNAIPQETMTSEQLRGMLNKGGVKADEMKWLGLDDFLEDTKGKKVNKAEVLAYIERNRVKIKETTRSDAPSKVSLFDEADRTMERLSRNDKWNRYDAELGEGIRVVVDPYNPVDIQFVDAAGKIVDRKIEFADDMRQLYKKAFRSARTEPTKYRSYKLPGGENYREVLFTLDPKPGKGEGWVVTDRNNQVVGRLDERPSNESMNEFRDQGYLVIPAKSGVLTPEYKSPHWDETNVLAHTRLTDRIDADGKRVLFIEEVQSDWHQQGREKGYNDTSALEELNAEHETLQQQKKLLEQEVKEIGARAKKLQAEWEKTPEYKTTVIRAKDGTELYRGTNKKKAFLAERENSGAYVDLNTGIEQPQELTKAQSDYQDAYRRWNDNQNRILQNEQQRRSFGPIPDAPLAKTWHEMVMKRVLRMAAEDGYERVAWTTGEQQSARYDLSHQVDKIEYSLDRKNEMAYLEGTEQGEPVFNQQVAFKDLPGMIGKDATDKMLAGDADGSLEGANLAVGGEGMKGFYDRMLPSWAEKYGKKWGAAVGETTLGEGTRRVNAYGKDGSLEYWSLEGETLEQFQADMERRGFKPGELTFKYSEPEGGARVHSIDVTPAMVRSVMEGQPLFQKGAPITDTSLINKAVDRYGITDSFEDAGYILPDGRMLDFNRRDDPGNWTLHSEIAEIMSDRFEMPEDAYAAIYTPAIDAFVAETTSIRMNHDMDQTSLQIGGPLTDQQKRLLRNGIAKDFDHPINVEYVDPITGERKSLRGDGSIMGFNRLMKDIEQMVGEPQRIHPESRKLIDHINKKDWWRTAMPEDQAVQDRGVFLASTFREAEFYGRPLDNAFRADVTNPLVGDERTVMAALQLPIIENITVEQRMKMDARMKRAAARLGYDSIAIMSDKAYAAYKEKGTLPRSIELQVLEKKQVKQPGTSQDQPAKNTQMTLFQKDQPIGTMDDASGFKADSEWQDEGWRQHVQPMLDAMQDVAINKLTNERPLDGAMRDMSPEGQKMLRDYMRRVKTDMATTKNSTMKWGESQRDFAMLNYNRRYGFDRYLDVVAPYQFYFTRSLMTWGMRAIDKPSWFANYARLRNMQNRYEQDIPERLRNKFKIEAPWLPDWMGDALYIDPVGFLFTPANFMRPIETMRRDKQYQLIEAERVLQEWASDGTVDQAQIAQAASQRSGALWERAVAEASMRREKEIASPFDFMSTLLGPAWYLSAPLNAMGIKVPGISDGDRNKISNLPLTNTARSFETVTKGTWAEPIGQFVGLAGKPEEWIRKKAGMPEFSEYGDYYVDRQLSNMVAEGLITSDQATTAMIERQGELFDQARERVKMELAMRVPLMGTTYALTHGGVGDAAKAFVPSLFGSGLLPEGELKYRGLKQEWNEAWKKADAGDKNAINAFFDKHPEYEAYLAKGKQPEERLRSFLVGNIWDAYMTLGETNRKQATTLMGEEFQRSFLNTETRSIETIPVETLTQWARMLGTMVPKTEQTAPVLEQPAPTLNLYDPQVTNITDRFFQERKQKFPDYFMLEQGFYSLPRSQQAQYLLKFPRYAEFRKWRDGYYKDYPELKPIFQGKVFKKIDTSTWAPGLEEYVTVYAMTGKKLPKGATSAMQQIWIREGMPYGDFNTWLNSQVVPAFLYQQQTPMNQ